MCRRGFSSGLSRFCGLFVVVVVVLVMLCLRTSNAKAVSYQLKTGTVSLSFDSFIG